MLRIGPDIFIILSTPSAPITILITTALTLYGSFPFDTFSKKLDPAVSKPIDVVKQARLIAIAIIVLPILPNTPWAIKSSNEVFEISVDTSVVVCAPSIVSPP